MEPKELHRLPAQVGGGGKVATRDTFALDLGKPECNMTEPRAGGRGAMVVVERVIASNSVRPGPGRINSIAIGLSKHRRFDVLSQLQRHSARS